MPAPLYDNLAPFYHHLYGDWEGAIVKQGKALADLFRQEGILPGEQVLDAACGVGTQTLGLLASGYQVTASDISEGAVKRLNSELLKRNLVATTRVDDIRTLRHTPSNSMASVIACDNSIPHLLSDGEILAAFRSCYRCIRPDGLVVLSVRDYATIARVNPDVRPYGLRYEDSGRFLAVQVWEWDGEQYDLRIYLTSESADGVCTTQVLKSRYYAISIERLMSLMAEAGFVKISRREDVMFQPVISGRRPSAA